LGGGLAGHSWNKSSLEQNDQFQALFAPPKNSGFCSHEIPTSATLLTHQYYHGFIKESLVFLTMVQP